MTDRSENTRAALWMVGSMAAFAVEDLFLKRAAADMPPGQVLVINGLIGGTIFALLALRRGEQPFSLAAFRGHALARNLAEAVAALLYILVLALAPLSFAAALLQALPLMVTAGAALFLGETVGWRRWTSILVGLLGVMIILQPWNSGFDAIGLAMLASVAAVAVRDLVTRRMPATTGSMSLSCWGVYACVPGGVVLMIARDEALILPGGGASAGLAAAIVFGCIGYYMVVAAMRLGEVSVVAPFRYTRLVFSVLLAVVFLGERPTAAVMLGAAIVTASGLYVLSRERKRKAGLPQSGAGG